MFKNTVIVVYFDIIPQLMHQSCGKVQNCWASDPRFDSGSMQFSVVVVVVFFCLFFFFLFFLFFFLRLFDKKASSYGVQSYLTICHGVCE